MSQVSRRRRVYIIAGPNGSGKTTFAREFLPHYVHCEHFVNADLIAGGLSPFAPEAAALRAGRLVLGQIRLLASQGRDFAFETTLAGLTQLRLLRRLKMHGYGLHLFFLWIPSVELALARIAERVRQGGHAVAEPVVRRRFHKGLRHLFTRYRPLLDAWALFDNSGAEPRLIAREELGTLVVLDERLFATLSAAAEGP